MSEKFKAVIDNDYFTTGDKYWRVTIEANNLNTLNEICNVLHFMNKNRKESVE